MLLMLYRASFEQKETDSNSSVESRIRFESVRRTLLVMSPTFIIFLKTMLPVYFENESNDYVAGTFSKRAQNPARNESDVYIADVVYALRFSRA